MNKRYLFSVVETASQKAFSLLLTPGSLILGVLALLLIIGGIMWPVSNHLQRAREQQLIQQFHKENQELKSTLSNYHHRLNELEGTLTEMLKSNPYFKTMAESSFTDSLSYGVGGPASVESGEIISSHDTEILSKLERQVATLHDRIATLDTSMSKRIQEIAHYPSIRPVRTGWISSGFGTRLDPFTGKRERHPGLDISLPIGTAVYATADGVVKEIKRIYIPNKSYGRYIILDHGNGYETLYAHLSKILVKKGQKIKRWDLIAHTGDSGKSTAPHLHYGVYTAGKAQDPLHYILE